MPNILPHYHTTITINKIASSNYKQVEAKGIEVWRKSSKGAVN